MSWPIKDETLDAIDWSWYQQNSDGSFIDVDEFMARNPNVKVVILRATWVNGALDRSYPHYYREFRKHDVIIIAYLWPNPLRTDMLARWTEALLAADDMPDGLMLDFELTFYQSNEVLTDNAEQAWEDAETFDLPVIGYTRGNWWETHIIRTVERGKYFIVAHYPQFMIEGRWQFCRNHADLHAKLPIDNNFTPYLGRLKPEQVLGWQFSAKGRLAPYTKDMDLDSLIKALIDLLFRPDQNPDPDPKTTTVEIIHNAPIKVLVKEPSGWQLTT